MADYGKNSLPGDFYSLVVSDPVDYFNYTMNRISDNIEHVSLSTKRNLYKVVCLSGEIGNISEARRRRRNIPTAPRSIMLADGNMRWAVRFRIWEDPYNTNIDKPFTSVFPDPLRS